MTSQLKIRCLLKTTAKEFWTKQRGEKKKSCFEKEGGEEKRWGRVGGVTGSLSL